MDDHKNEKRVYRLVLTGGEFYNRNIQHLILLQITKREK